MSDDPVAVIYSASLIGALSLCVAPRAQMEIRTLSPNQKHGPEGLGPHQVRESAGSDRFAIDSPFSACAISGW
jgi:hypothetical protein